MCIIHRDPQQTIEPSNRNTSNGTIRHNHGLIEGTWQVHRLRSPLMDHIQPSTSIKIPSSDRIINNRRRKHPSASVAARRIPSPYLQNYAQSPTDHAPTRTKARGNHRTHPQEITIYNNTNIRKIKPHRIARRRIPRLPHPMKTIKNNLHHRT